MLVLQHLIFCRRRIEQSLRQLCIVPFTWDIPTTLYGMRDAFSFKWGIIQCLTISQRVLLAIFPPRSSASRIVLKATFPRGRDILGERAVCCRVDPLRGDPDVQGDEGGRDPGHPGQEGSQEERQPRLLMLLLWSQNTKICSSVYRASQDILLDLPKFCHSVKQDLTPRLTLWPLRREVV